MLRRPLLIRQILLRPEVETAIREPHQLLALAPLDDVHVDGVQRDDSVDVNFLPLPVAAGAPDALCHGLVVEVLGVGPEGPEEDDMVGIRQVRAGGGVFGRVEDEHALGVRASGVLEFLHQFAVLGLVGVVQRDIGDAGGFECVGKGPQQLIMLEEQNDLLVLWNLV